MDLVRRLALALTAVAAFAFPAVAEAELITYGSDLSAPANSVEPDNGIHPNYGGLWNGADTAFWNASFADGRSGVAPADGQIIEFRVKGIGLRGPGQAADPKVLVHFQSLTPQGGGALKVDLSSGEMYWPLDGDPQQITTVHPINHCIERGDYVAFNTWGGHEWRFGNHGGVPLQIFSTVPSANLNWYEKDNGTNNGQTFPAVNARPNRELLLQAVLATGPDATDICHGGYKQHVYQGLTVEPQSAILRVKSRVAKIRVSCPGESYGACDGTLRLDATIDGAPITLGSKQFRIAPATTTNLDVPLPAENIAHVQRLRALTVTAVAESHDDPVAVNEHDVPVQSRRTSRELDLAPDLFQSRTGCASAKTLEKAALKALAKAKKAQKTAKTSPAKKKAYKKVKVARKKAVLATAARRVACT